MRFATAAIACHVANKDERAISSVANDMTVGGVFGDLKDQKPAPQPRRPEARKGRHVSWARVRPGADRVLG